MTEEDKEGEDSQKVDIYTILYPTDNEETDLLIGLHVAELDDQWCVDVQSNLFNWRITVSSKDHLAYRGDYYCFPKDEIPYPTVIIKALRFAKEGKITGYVRRRTIGGIFYYRLNPQDKYQDPSVIDPDYGEEKDKRYE